MSGINLIYANPASGDLHLTNTVDIVVDGKAIPLTTVTTDFDNQSRSTTTPDIGADEFEPGSLPIIIEYFTGKNQAAINIITWKAACSSTAVAFEIERSNNGRTFTSIEKIVATQARCAQPFTADDKMPQPGINYYRLKMIESDGLVTYSAIIAILNKEAGFEILGIMPTLVRQNTVLLSITSAQNTQVTVAITDLAGKMMQTQKVNVGSGSGIVKVNIENLPNGTYQLTCLPVTGNAATFRFIKLE